MRAIVLEALRAGALGFSTSRTIGHRAIDGEVVPGTYAAEDELFGIGAALADARTGVFELAPLGAAGEEPEGVMGEVDWMRRLSAAIDRPVSFALLQVDSAPDLWRTQLDESLEACAEGAQLYPQVAGRPTGLLTGHHATFCLFADIPPYRALKARKLSPAEFAQALADPEVRRAIVSWTPSSPAAAQAMERAYRHVYVLGDPPDYEPGPERSLAGLAAALASRLWRSPTTRWPRAAAPDCCTCRSSTTPPATSTTSTRCCCTHRAASVCPTAARTRGTICDGEHAHLHAHPLDARPHAGRDAAARVRGAQADAATRPGSTGCPTGAPWSPGELGDFNLIDYDGLTLGAPFVRADLPAGGRRLAPGGDGVRGHDQAGDAHLRPR